jgi:hypothetical protein
LAFKILLVYAKNNNTFSRKLPIFIAKVETALLKARFFRKTLFRNLQSSFVKDEKNVSVTE